MQYRVIKMFTDLQDKEYAYQVGDTYPREGLSPTDERIAELSGSRNRQGKPLIEAIPEEPAAESLKAVNIPETEETDVPDTDAREITEAKPRKRKHKGDE
jgi:hypothetical protein